MNKYVIVAFNLSIGIGAVIGAIRFKKISSAYYPFLFYLWIGFANEITSQIVKLFYHTTAVNNNIWYLVEACLVTTQFYVWNLFPKKNLFYCLLLSFGLVWYAVIFSYGISVFASWFIVFYSFIMAIMSIAMVNKILSQNKKSIVRNSMFLICLGFIIFFIYAIFVEIVWMSGKNASLSFQVGVVYILGFVNLFINFLFAVAVLWIPRRQGYISS